MKKAVFYFLTFAIILLELVIFGWAFRIRAPLFSVASLVLGIAVIYIARMYIDEVIEDERTQKIRERTAMTTLLVTWVALLVFSVWMIIEGTGIRAPLEIRRLGIFGFGLLLTDIAMVVVFVLLSFYYQKQYGE
ncbi:MAG: DUF2178 domain-containing protein [Methanoregulaceae archaeon]|nr:DUF2178 domain-containing protein [Methanoregulaceae archaeon]